VLLIYLLTFQLTSSSASHLKFDIARTFGSVSAFFTPLQYGTAVYYVRYSLQSFKDLSFWSTVPSLIKSPGMHLPFVILMLSCDVLSTDWFIDYYLFILLMTVYCRNYRKSRSI